MKEKKVRERKLVRDKIGETPRFSDSQLDYLESKFVRQFSEEDNADILRWKAAQAQTITDIINIELELRAEDLASMKHKSPGKLYDN